MALLAGSNVLDTDFTPVVGAFIVEVSGEYAVKLLRKNTSGAGYSSVGYIPSETAMNVDNPVAGAVYRFQSIGPAITRADQ